jgi:dihydroorotate dehydrogenase (fumarate)
VTGGEIEQMYVEVVKEVKGKVKIPVSVKVGPYFSSVANMASNLAKAGADALVLFNRFYQPDFDLVKLEVEPKLVLSNPADMRLPLHWTAILYGRVPVDIAVTSGVHGHEDVIKAVMAGACVTQMASELLVNGVGRIGQILNDLGRWMTEYEYDSIQQMKGSMSKQHVVEPAAFERANYMKELYSFKA